MKCLVIALNNNITAVIELVNVVVVGIEGCLRVKRKRLTRTVLNTYLTVDLIYT